MPGEPRRRRALERRGHVPLVRPRVRPAVVGADHERLKRQPAVVTLAALAPGRADLVLMAGPRAGRRHARPRCRVPFRLPRTLPLVATVLLAVPVGVTAAERQTAPDCLGAIRTGHIEPAEAADVVAESPGRIGRVRVGTRRSAHPAVEADGHVPRQQVDHAAERGRPVQGRAGALHHLDALYVIQRQHVPVDAAPVGLVRGYAVHQQEHARSQAFDEAARPANVDLTVEEQHSRGLVHRLVDRAHGAPREIAVADERHTRGGLVEQLGPLRRGHDHGLERVSTRSQRDVQAYRVARRNGHSVLRGVIAETREAEHRTARGDPRQPIVAGRIRGGGRPRGADVDVGDRRSGRVRDCAVHRSRGLRLSPQRQEGQRDQRPGGDAGQGHGGK